MFIDKFKRLCKTLNKNYIQDFNKTDQQNPNIIYLNRHWTKFEPNKQNKL